MGTRKPPAAQPRALQTSDSTPEATATRRCARCAQILPLDGFPSNVSQPLGRAHLCRACTRDDQRSQPERHWVYSYRTRCLKYGISPVVKPFTKADLVALWGSACVDCGGPFESLDHQIPVAAGGGHSVGNCRPRCKACNRRKYDSHDRKLIAEYRA